MNGINTEAHTNATQRTVGSDGTVTSTFWLQGDQSLKILGLAKGTTYSINENKTAMDAESYEVAATIAGDTKYSDAPGATAKDITLDDASVSGDPAYRMDDTYIQNDTTVTYTNKKVGIIPTGVTLAVLPGAAVAVAGAAGIVVLAAKKRKKEDED